MDYEAILRHLGDLGKYQKLLIFRLFLPVFFTGFSIVIPNFILGDHRHRCKIPWMDNDTYAIQNSQHWDLVNSTIPLTADGEYEMCSVLVNGTETNCEEWVYDQSIFTETVISQFNLVCDRKLVKSHVVFMTFIGFLSSPFIMNTMADILGRHPMYCTCITVIAFVNIILPFVTNLYLLMVLRFFDGFFFIPLYQFSFIIGIELVGPSGRDVISALLLIVFCASELRLTLFAYLIRDWRWLQLACAVTNIPFLIFWWRRIIPESPRWLISKDRTEEALSVIQRAARVNKVQLPPEASSLKIADRTQLNFLQILQQLCRSKRLLFCLAIAMSNWFVASFTHYGIKMNIGKLGGNIFETFTIAVVAEVVGFVFILPMDRVGHKRLLVMALAATAVSCLVPSVLVLCVDSTPKWVIVTFIMLGKLFASTVFGMIYTVTGELFPTDIRSFTLGSCSFFARIGSLASPYLYQIIPVAGKLQRALPLILYSAVFIVVALLSLNLPETTKVKLKDQIEDRVEKEVVPENLPLKENGMEKENNET